jgi:hypothetical protein
MTYTMTATAPVAPGIASPVIPGSTTLYIDIAAPTQVTDLGSKTPIGNKTYKPFYTFTAKEISPGLTTTTWDYAGITGPTAGWKAPVILDKYGDQLPILYFRKSPGIDGTGTVSNNAVTTQNTPAIVGVNPPAAGTNFDASYYLNENSAYTADGTTLTSPSSTQFQQGNYTSNGKQFTYSANTMATLISNINGSTATAHGGYALISAGYDRYYGMVGGVSDDLFVVGGH